MRRSEVAGGPKGLLLVLEGTRGTGGLIKSFGRIASRAWPSESGRHCHGLFDVVGGEGSERAVSGQ